MKPFLVLHLLFFLALALPVTLYIEQIYYHYANWLFVLDYM